MLSRIPRLIQQKKNVDAEIWAHFGRPPSDPDLIWTSPDRALLTAALCSLLTTSLCYTPARLPAAVRACGSNPKLAYTALAYLRLRVKPLTDHLDPLFELLMMLDPEHLAKSPVNRLPQELSFDQERQKALVERLGWPQAPRPLDLALDLALCRARDPRALASLHHADPRLLAHAASIWFSTKEFLECPPSYQFDPQWTEIILAQVPTLQKKRAFGVFEETEIGPLVLYAFFTIVRPPTLPRLATSPENTAWIAIFEYFFLEKPLPPTLLDKLPLKGKLLALDILMRSDNHPRLAAQFAALYKPGLVDPEPVLALMLQRGYFEHAQGLYPPATATTTAPATATATELARAIHTLPSFEVAPLLASALRRGPAQGALLMEQALPLIKRLAVQGSGTMVKLEYASLAIHGLLVMVYRYMGHTQAAEQALQAGGARAAGLDAPAWRDFFGHGAASVASQLDAICDFPPDPPEIAEGASLLRRKTRNALFGTIRDTLLSIPDLCGLPRRPRRRAYDPTPVLETWRSLASPLSARALEENARAVLADGALVGVLGHDPNPWFQTAANMLLSPLYYFYRGGGPPAGAPVRPGEVLLTFNHTGSTLVVSRMLVGSSITLQIPVYGLQDAIKELSELVKKSTTLSRSQFGGSSDEWWRQQKRHGKTARDLLHKLEGALFSGLTGLLSPLSLLGTPLLAEVRAAAVQLFARFLGLPPASLSIRDEILDLFCEVAKQRAMGAAPSAEFGKALAASLCSLLIDGLRLAGHPIDYDMIDMVDLEHAVVTLLFSYKLPPLQQLHLVLVPDPGLAELPWESLPCLSEVESISRCLSLGHYSDLCREPKPCQPHEDQDTEPDEPAMAPAPAFLETINYTLNPQKDLPAAQEMFAGRLKQYKGFCGREPSEREVVDSLETASCYIYIGHGSGYRFIRASTVRRLERCAAVMLFGCSSAKLSEGAGPLLDHTIAGCRLFVGFIWDVPNTDCNLFTHEFLQLLLEDGVEVFKALRRARRVCRIFTTSMAPVVYGIP